MLEERDTRSPPWGWLRGFGWFLVAWPLISLLAADKLDFADWESIALAVLGPAAIGLVLLGVEVVLTRLFGARLGAAPRAVPSLLRDLSNLGVALAILLAIDVALVTFADDDPMIRGGDPRAATLAATLLAGFCGAALVLRAAARLVHGRPRRVDMGEGWDRAPVVQRFLGYLTLIPTLLVCTVMIDYTLHGRPDFGTAAWIALPALLWLGLRSAMASAPRWWARNPWEAWLRATSLALPWWIAGLAVAFGFAALCLLIPFGVIDEEMTTRGRILAGFVLAPLGLLVLGFAAVTLARGAPALLRGWLVARRLARGREAVAAWTPTGGQIKVVLADRREAVFEMGAEAPACAAWLAARAPGVGPAGR